MSMIKPSYGTANLQLNARFAFIWLVVPALILAIIVLVAARFCFKSYLNAVGQLSFVEDADQPATAVELREAP